MRLRGLMIGLLLLGACAGESPQEPVSGLPPLPGGMRAPGVYAASLHAATQGHPWALTHEQATHRVDSTANPADSFGVFHALLSFYQTVVSPIDGDRCNMAPTCSRYSHLALETHGVLLGVMLTADRLLHEADEVGHVPEVTGTTRFGLTETYYYDPLLANTYWWQN